MDLLMQYIVASTELYGIVPREKVLEIYNAQNDKTLSLKEFEAYVDENEKILEDHEVHLQYIFFVQEAIVFYDNFESELEKKHNKPYFIPPKEELLKYLDDFYVEQSKQYRKVEKFIREKLIPDDDEKASFIAMDTALQLRLEIPIGEVLEEYNRLGVVFNKEKDVRDFLPLLADLANNVRVWSTNGYKPRELSYDLQKDFEREDFNIPSILKVFQPVKSKKVGRNDPCPCGSGKKYKKCCINK